MRIENPFLSNLGISIPNSLAEQNDSVLQVPNLVLNTVEPISPLFRLVGSGGTSESSQNSAVTVTRNNQAGANNTLFTLSKGLYEVNLHLSARFDWTAVGTSYHTVMSLVNPAGSSVNPLIVFYAQSGIQVHNRTFRLLVAEAGWVIRLEYGSTGVAEHLDATGSCHLTRIL